MRDVIWTIIAVWVVFQIYRAFKSTRINVFQNNQHNYNTQREGEVKIEKEPSSRHEGNKKPNSDKGGEYVDFEEIKD